MKTVLGIKQDATRRSRRILRAGFAAMMGLIAGICLFSAFALHQASTALNNVVYKDQVAVEMLFRMLQAARERSILLFRIVNTDDPFEQDAQLMRIRELAGEFIEARQKLLSSEINTEVTERALLDLQGQQTQESSRLLDQVIGLVTAGRQEEAIHFLAEKAVPAQNASMDTINSLIEHEILETHLHVEQLQSLHERLNWLLAFAGAAAISLVALVARFVRRRMDGLTGEIMASSHDLEEANRQLAQQKMAMDEHDIVSIADVHGNITYVNDKFCEVSQYSRDEMLGQNHRILKSTVHSDRFYRDMWETISNSRIWRGEVCNRKKDGSHYWVYTTIVPFVDDAGLPYQYVSVRTEITDIKKAQEILARSRDQMENLVLARTIELAEREEMLLSITDSAQDAVVMVNHEAKVTYWNPAAEKIFGYTAAEIMGGDPCAMLVPKQYCGVMKTAFDEFRKTGAGSLIGKTSELTAMRNSGEEFPVEVSLSAIKIMGGWHAVAIARDISARKLAEQRLEQMATTDPLTGISNRRRFNELLHIECSRSQRYRVPLSLIMFDIDYFKRINDSFGHPVGDSVLIQFTNLISANIRETDVFARLGGEEFAILAPNCDLGCASQFAEKLRRLVESQLFAEVGPITCSFGAVEFNDSDDEGTLIRRADEALYQAKSAGRNRVFADENPAMVGRDIKKDAFSQS